MKLDLSQPEREILLAILDQNPSGLSILEVHSILRLKDALSSGEITLDWGDFDYLQHRFVLARFAHAANEVATIAMKFSLAIMQMFPAGTEGD